jgi:hypothetical protein
MLLTSLHFQLESYLFASFALPELSCSFLSLHFPQRTNRASRHLTPDTKNKMASQPAAGVSLGKGAWDVDAKCEIPPEREALVFEETASMDFDFNGLPTVPPRKVRGCEELFFLFLAKGPFSSDARLQIERSGPHSLQGGAAAASHPEQAS